MMELMQRIEQALKDAIREKMKTREMPCGCSSRP